MTPGTVFKHFIFFVTYIRAQYARILHYSKLERLVSDKNSSLLRPFISYEENELLWIQPQGPYYFLRNLQMDPIC